MALRVSGLNSGLDTDSIVKELVNAYSIKKEKYVKEKTKLEWKQDKWKDLNTKIYNLYNKTLTSMKFSSAYNKKTTKSSNESKATVTASNTAINGTQKLEIEELAKTGYLTGAEIKKQNGKAVDLNSTLSDLGFAGTGNIAVKVGDQTTNIELTDTMSINTFVNKLKDAGVSANFDATNQRMFISAKDSGKANDFSLTGTDSKGLEALSKLGVLTDSKATTETYAQWTSYAKYDGSGNLDETATKQYMQDVLDEMTSKEAVNVGLNNDISDFNTNNAKLNEKKTFLLVSRTVEETLGKATLNASETAELEGLLRTEDRTDAQNERVEALKVASGLSDDDFKGLAGNCSYMASYENTVNTEGSAQDIADMNQAKIDATNETAFNSNLAALNNQISDNNTGIKTKQDEIDVNNDYISKNKVLRTADGQNENMNTLFNKVSNAVKYTKGDYNSLKSDAKRIEAEDAKITLNGATFTSSSNTINVNGLTITALEKTEGEPITISTNTDTQGIYDTIKGFITEYNTLIKEMDKLYNAGSSKGYEPLTDDEKEQMTDDEIKKWEEKIKDSLLRRDSTLSTVMTSMTSAMSRTYEVNGKKYSLASFGIKTTSYFSAGENEKNVFHIDGDKDDATVSGAADSLLKALQEDPSAVEDFFKQLTDGVYKELDGKMKSSSLRSSQHVYNDKKMKEDIKNYDKTIKKWENKLEYYEKFYYDKFTAMETALAKLQNNTNSLSQLLGG